MQGWSCRVLGNLSLGLFRRQCYSSIPGNAPGSRWHLHKRAVLFEAFKEDPKVGQGSVLDALAMRMSASLSKRKEGSLSTDH